MLTRADKIQLLAQRGWLSYTPEPFRRSVLARIRLRNFRRGQAVYRAGDELGGLWAIVEGAVEIEMPPPGAAPHLVHFAAPGFWFGEGPLLTGTRRLVTVIATSDSALASLSLADLHAILAADPAGWRWIALLSYMTTDLSAGMVADLLLREPAKRVAALLLRLGGVRSRVFPAAAAVPIQLSQTKLAHLVNLSRNSITPILRRFVRGGWIEVRYGSIVIKDANGLFATIATASH